MKSKDNFMLIFGILQLSAVLIFILIMLLVVVVQDNNRISKLESFSSFELEKYEFNESECMESHLEQKDDLAPGFNDAYYDCFTVVWKKWDRCFQTNSSNWKECNHFYDTEQTKCDLLKTRICDLYCHTEQVKTGEECKDLGYRECCQVNPKLPMTRFCHSWNKHYENSPDWICTSQVCTPTYETRQGFCATPEQITQAKELIK